MCGRARCTLNAQQVASACGIRGTEVRTLQMERFRPTYNVSPGSYMPVAMIDGGGEAVVHCMKWGLVPSFTSKNEKPNHFRMFNARSESIHEKASFRRLVPKNRCLVAVEGFYEWKKDGSKKQPYYIHFKDHRPLVFAALYDSWVNSEAEILHTFTILTSSSSSSLQWLHDRMPVMLGDEKSINEWLTSSSSKFDLLLKPYEGSDLAWYPVTPAMGNVSFDGPECIKEIQLKAGVGKPISNFFIKKTDDGKLSSSEVRNPVKETVQMFMLDNIKEPIIINTGIQEGNLKHSGDIKKEADPLETTNEESNKMTDQEPSSERIKIETPETRARKDFEKHAQECKAMIQESNDENDEQERELDGHGVKRMYNQIENKGCRLPSVSTSHQVQSAARKKGKCIGTTGDGQSTLLSFFGKK